MSSQHIWHHTMNSSILSIKTGYEHEHITLEFNPIQQHHKLVPPFTKMCLMQGCCTGLHLHAVSLTNRQFVPFCCLSWSVYVQIQTVLWKLWWDVLHWHGPRNIHNYFWILDTPEIEREKGKKCVSSKEEKKRLLKFWHVLCPFVNQGSQSLTWGAGVCHLSHPPRVLYPGEQQSGGATLGDGQRGFPGFASPSSLCLSPWCMPLWFDHFLERPQGRRSLLKIQVCVLYVKGPYQCFCKVTVNVYFYITACLFPRHAISFGFLNVLNQSYLAETWGLD